MGVVSNLPRISVLLPVFNAERHIDACLASLCRSDYPKLEICIIDDGSSDTTPQRLARWRDRDPRIRLRDIGAEFNVGYTAIGNARARGEEYVKDNPDIMEKSRILKS